MKPLRLIDPRNDKVPEFRVPQFEVRIDGAGLPKDVLRDVSEITYRDSLTELGQFEMVVSNWEPELRQFKYIGSETTKNKNSYPYNLFEPCGKKVRIKFGYINVMTSMMVGTFTTMETSFSQSGASTVTVRGLDDFHSMRRKKYSASWTKKTPSEIAKDIGSKSDKGKKRFPLPVKILDGTEGREKDRKIDFVAQSSQFDIDFLLNLARQHGYEIYIEYYEKDNDKAVALCFGNPSDEPTILQLDWGQTLIDFKPTLTTAGQFKSITVKGWDRRTQKPIEAKVEFDDRELRGLNKRFGELVKQCDPQENETYSLPVFSKSDAHARALALMRDNNARIIRATGTTIGFPELRAGTKLRILGVGARLSGEYLVLKSTHSIGEGGYTTKFECRLEDYEQGKSS
jgi:phage protein D